jgi:uncharacterized protein YbjT (DUF2867 family)
MSTPSAPFKKVLLIGAGGSIGRYILAALLAEPTLTITVLTRASSTSTLPADVPSITIPDTYPTADLEAAFRG